MSDARPLTPENLARYLDRVRSSYPYGIPASAIRMPTSSVHSVVSAPVVSFLVVEAAGIVPPEHEALIDSIVSKGLKLPLDRTARRVVKNPTELRIAVEEHAAYDGVVIILGAEQPDGRLEQLGGACVLHSHSLAAIATDPSVKRTFWGHLQTVLGRIA
jgi:hypothetical protein